MSGDGVMMETRGNHLEKKCPLKFTKVNRARTCIQPILLVANMVCLLAQTQQLQSDLNAVLQIRFNNEADIGFQLSLLCLKWLSAAGHFALFGN